MGDDFETDVLADAAPRATTLNGLSTVAPGPAVDGTLYQLEPSPAAPSPIMSSFLSHVGSESPPFPADPGAAPRDRVTPAPTSGQMPVGDGAIRGLAPPDQGGARLDRVGRASPQRGGELDRRRAQRRRAHQRRHSAVSGWACPRHGAGIRPRRRFARAGPGKRRKARDASGPERQRLSPACERGARPAASCPLLSPPASDGGGQPSATGCTTHGSARPSGRVDSPTAVLTRSSPVASPSAIDPGALSASTIPQTHSDPQGAPASRGPSAHVPWMARVPPRLFIQTGVAVVVIALLLLKLG